MPATPMIRRCDSGVVLNLSAEVLAVKRGEAFAELYPEARYYIPQALLTSCSICCSILNRPKRYTETSLMTPRSQSVSDLRGHESDLGPGPDSKRSFQDVSSFNRLVLLITILSISSILRILPHSRRSDHISIVGKPHHGTRTKHACASLSTHFKYSNIHTSGSSSTFTKYRSLRRLRLPRRPQITRSLAQACTKSTTANTGNKYTTTTSATSTSSRRRCILCLCMSSRSQSSRSMGQSITAASGARRGQ